MKVYLCPLIIITWSIAYNLNAQSITNVNRDIDVTRVYEQVIEEGYATPEIFLKLANAYYYENRFEDAKKYFEKVFETNLPKTEILQYRYSQTLKALKLTQNKDNVKTAGEI